MSDKHDHHGHDHDHPIPLKEPSESIPAAAAEDAAAPAEEAGSQALANALSSSFVIVKALMAALVFVFLCSGIFTVPSSERAIVLRFGKPSGEGDARLLGPGLHWSFPYPIDEVVKVPFTEIQTVTSTVGWYAVTPEEEAAGSEPAPDMSLSPIRDGYALTSDANIIHVRATLRYRVTEPLTYLLGFVNASNVVQNALNNALHFASFQYKVDQALTQDKLGFQEKITSRVRDLIAQQKLGVTVDQCEVRAIPPRQTKKAFDDAFAAEVERRKSVDDARAYANKVLSTAEGEANSILNIAKTDRSRLVEAVAAESRYYLDQLPYYRENPKLFMARLQAEVLGRVMTNSQDKIYIPSRADGKSRELRLLLSREPQKPKEAPSGR